MTFDTAVVDSVEAAQAEVMDQEPQQLARDLQELLGQKMVAFALGDRHPKSIGRYARGERGPDDAALARLVDLATVVMVLRRGRSGDGSDGWIKKWMLGSNARLGGKSPIEAFHQGKAPRVMGAAKVFTSNR